MIEWGRRHTPKAGGALSYLLVSVLMGLALLVRLALFPLEAGLQYLTFFPAVALAFVIGGFGPGLFSVLIGMCLATFIFIPPFYAISLHSLYAAFWSNVVFLVDGVIVGSAVMAMQRHQSRLDSTIDSLQITRQAIEGTSDGYWLCDASGKLLDVNNSYCRMSGYSRQELLTMRIPDLEANETPGETAEHMRKLIEHGCDVFETKHRRKNGEIVDIEISTSYLKRGDGYFSVFARDISERKRIETELRNSEEKFRHLYENAPIGIAMAKQDQKIVSANAAYCRMFGCTQEELRDLTISDLTHPDFQQSTQQMSHDLLEGEFPSYAFEKKYQRGDGSTFWGRIIATRLVSGNPQENYIMGIVEDITDRVEYEIQRISDVLEQRDVLVREVHHRIKNNLQGVVGLLRQHASDHPEMNEVTDVVVRRIYSIAVIHGLQAHALAEEVELDGLVKGILDASEGNVNYRNNLHCKVFLSKDEAVPIALVLNELVTNACKHRAANTRLEIRLDTDRDDTLITIDNHFEEVGPEAAGDGQGLALVNSLLPRKSAHLLALRRGDIYSAELRLSPPVTINRA
ncbi:MAG: PAS/PAC sensor signal transduction histidine kinase [Gallionellaceae bacterium]|nr:MAG: PAS/PAC sensor signal transduction histidine kinase [Gallionellaceae bacterium]